MPGTVSLLPILFLASLPQSPTSPAPAANELDRHHQLDLQSGWRWLLEGDNPAEWRTPDGAAVDPQRLEAGVLLFTRDSPAWVTFETFGDVDFECQWTWNDRSGAWIETAHSRTRRVLRSGSYESWTDGLHRRHLVQQDSGADLHDFGDWPGYQEKVRYRTLGRTDLDEEQAPIVLCGGNDVTTYSSVRIRDWSAIPHTDIDLFPGDALEAWIPLGDAIYERVENPGSTNEVLGTIGGGSQSFLMTQAEFADFLLEVDVKTELPGNSGIQIRSHVNEKGRLFGYQIEIDPSERAWSGGLYDEARRGWLDDLADNPDARAAFQPGEWNRYRIECIGPRIQTWINEVPAANYIDDAEEADASGHIALQVHSGNNTRVRWRNFRLRVLQ